MTPAEKDPFYIGYLPKAPKAVASVVVKAVSGIAVVLLVVALSIALRQQPAENSVFEFGTYTTITGVIFEKPYPLLRVNAGTNTQGNAVYQSIPLVNLGKRGVAHIIDELGRNTALNQAEVTISGTLIYYDGKSLLELSEGKASIKGTKQASSPVQAQATGTWHEATLAGEIVDGKCFFGVMKPGYGKAHRSCAVRCIAGGIPPVLSVKNSSGGYDYYLLTGPNGQAYNQQVLPYTGKPVTISGRWRQVDDWQELQVTNLQTAQAGPARGTKPNNWLASGITVCQ